MADTAVAITAGSGTNIDTRTEATNGNHRQVIVIGDPSTNAGVAPVDATAGLKVDLGADNDVTVSGTVTANLAAGTNNIGDVDILSIAAGDNNIGNVDVVTLPALAAGTNNIGDVDVLTVNGVAPAFGSGARGATVQRVTIATDDVVPVTDNSGSLTVDAPVGTPVFVRLSDGAAAISTLPVSLASVPSHAVTNAGTFAVQESGSALTALQLIDDIVYVDDTATHSTGTSKGALIMAAATPTDSAVDANDIGAVAMSTSRELHTKVTAALPAGTNAIGKLASNDGVDIGDVTINNSTGASAVNIQDGGNSITVDNGGTFAVQATIASGATSIAKAEDVLSADADVGVPAMAVRKATPANTSGTDGDYEFLQMSAGRLWTSSTIDAALPAGTNAIGKLAANSGVDIGDVDVLTINGVAPAFGAGARGATVQRVTIATDDAIASVALNSDVRQSTASNLNAQVVGSIAHDGIDSGNPVKIGMRAIAHGANPTAVAAADRTDWLANRAGVPFIIGGHPNVISKEFVFADADGAQTNAALVSVAAGSKIVVTRASAICDDSNSSGVAVRIGFATATLPAVATTGAAGIILSHPGIPAGSGVVEGNGSGILGVGADDEDLRITCDDPVGGAIRVIISYYTIES